VRCLWNNNQVELKYIFLLLSDTGDMSVDSLGIFVASTTNENYPTALYNTGTPCIFPRLVRTCSESDFMISVVISLKGTIEQRVAQPPIPRELFEA
jgi:hypothetical protein